MSNLKIMVTKLEKWTWIFMQLSVIDKYCHLLTSLLTVYNWFWKSGNRHLVLLRLYLLEIFYLNVLTQSFILKQFTGTTNSFAHKLQYFFTF
jgi:hypothetical protein